MDDAKIARARAGWKHRGEGRPSWAVAPGPGQESVWDYPRPPRIDPDSRLVRILLDGLLTDFVAQRRMKISAGDYDPCYVIK